MPYVGTTNSDFEIFCQPETPGVYKVKKLVFYFGKNKSSGKFFFQFLKYQSSTSFYWNSIKKLKAPLVPTLSVRNPSIVPAGVEMADEENMDTDYMGQSNPMYDNGKNLTKNWPVILFSDTEQDMWKSKSSIFRQ